MRKRKIGLILILIGIGIPLVLFFFQKDGIVYTIKTEKIVERKLSPKEVKTLEEEREKIAKDWPKIKTTEELFGQADKGAKKAPPPEPGFLLDTDIEQIKRDAKKELILDIFGKNHFSKEKWTIYTYNRLSIPYRQTLGIGVFFVFIGIGIFIFSLFPKKEK